MESEFFVIFSIKHFGRARILVERRFLSSGKLETLGTKLSETSCGGTICSASGGEITGKEGFSNSADCGGGLALAKTQLHLAVQPNRSLLVHSV